MKMKIGVGVAVLSANPEGWIRARDISETGEVLGYASIWWSPPPAGKLYGKRRRREYLPRLRELLGGKCRTSESGGFDSMAQKEREEAK